MGLKRLQSIKKYIIMNYGALIIGFEYTKNNDWELLPGITVDLYQIYDYVKNLNRFKTLVFTDIANDHNTDTLKKAILDGHVDSGLLSFIEDIKVSNCYTIYQTQVLNQYTVNNFDQTIIDFVTGLDRLFLYYTGHGKNGNIILPDGTQVGMKYIKTLLNTYTNANCQIISLLDCCESDNKSLVSHPSYQHISIASTKINEETTTCKSGSKFTRSIINKFKNNKILLNCFDNIYISHPNIKYLWNWLILIDHNDITIDIDNTISIITITRH